MPVPDPIVGRMVFAVPVKLPDGKLGLGPIVPVPGLNEVGSTLPEMVKLPTLELGLGLAVPVPGMTGVESTVPDIPVALLVGKLGPGLTVPVPGPMDVGIGIGWIIVPLADEIGGRPVPPAPVPMVPVPDQIVVGRGIGWMIVALADERGGRPVPPDTPVPTVPVPGQTDVGKDAFHPGKVETMLTDGIVGTTPPLGVVTFVTEEALGEGVKAPPWVLFHGRVPVSVPLGSTETSPEALVLWSMVPVAFHGPGDWLGLGTCPDDAAEPVGSNVGPVTREPWLEAVPPLAVLFQNSVNLVPVGEVDPTVPD